MSHLVLQMHSLRLPQRSMRRCSGLRATSGHPKKRGSLPRTAAASRLLSPLESQVQCSLLHCQVLHLQAPGRRVHPGLWAPLALVAHPGLLAQVLLLHPLAHLVPGPCPLALLLPPTQQPAQQVEEAEAPASWLTLQEA